MKALFVRRLHLWPRFAAHVKEGLDDLPHTEVRTLCYSRGQPPVQPNRILSLLGASWRNAPVFI